jgi:hypothetical protein
MRRFEISQSNNNLTPTSGLALIGAAINQHTQLTQDLDKNIPLRHGLAHSDLIKSYLGLLAMGKNDFEAIHALGQDEFFKSALDIRDVPTVDRLRQRMDQRATAYLPILVQASIDFLRSTQAKLSPLPMGHIPLDADVTPFDNSGSKKEGVSFTYKKHDGFAPMAAYLGQEGYCIEFELREGKQHCQKGTPELLKRTLRRASQLTDDPILLRLDGGNDAIANIDVVLEHNEENTSANVDFIIKWNPRDKNTTEWLKMAEQEAVWHEPRPGKRVGLFEARVKRIWKGYEYSIRRVMRIVERTMDKQGQMLLVPEVEIEGWWTSLWNNHQDIIDLYSDHGTSEQFHSEFKTDMDIERLPSGKFATNALILACSVLIYNLLRWIGQNGLIGSDSPLRHPSKRRRIKTVMQELIYLAAKFTQTGRRLKIIFGKNCRVRDIFDRIYGSLAYP